MLLVLRTHSGTLPIQTGSKSLPLKLCSMKRLDQGHLNPLAVHMSRPGIEPRPSPSALEGTIRNLSVLFLTYFLWLHTIWLCFCRSRWTWRTTAWRGRWSPSSPSRPASTSSCLRNQTKSRFAVLGQGCYSETGLHIVMDRNFVCLWRSHNCNWSLPFCADLLIYEINYWVFKQFPINMQ